MTFSIHGRTGGGYAIGPVENTFDGVDLADAQLARDTYFAANPAKLAAYDSNPFYLIRLAYPDTVRAEFREGGQWIDYTPFLQGLPGEVASLVNVPVGELPFKKSDGTFGGSNMRLLEDGSILAPPGFGVESGSVQFGDVLLLSEQAGFLGIFNLLNNKQYTILDYATPRSAGSSRPTQFRLLGAEIPFNAQPVFSTNLTANPISVNYTVQNTARNNALTFKTSAPMANVLIKITKVSNGVVAKYIPNKTAWEEEEGGLTWAAGDNTVDLDDTPIIFNSGDVINFEIRSTANNVLGNPSGVPYIVSTQQVAEFHDVVMDDDYTATDVRDKLASLTGTNRLGIASIKDSVTSVAGRTGAVVLSASDVSGLATVATTGAYSSLSGLPTIPTNTNQLTNGSGFITAVQAPVQSVQGFTGSVVLTKTDIGLGNVDNTSDINKPVSTAQQTAIDAKMTQHTASVDPHPQYTTTAEASAAAPVQTVNGLTGAVVISTGNIAEVGNLFYTDGRVQTYITGAGYNVKSVASVGAGAPVYQGNSSGAVTLRSIIGTGAINITQNTNDITIFTSIVNSGVGQGVVKGTVTGVTTMKGITAGRGMTITSNTDDVQVSSTQFPLVYNASGQAASPKIWYGTVTSDANGDFTVNYATAGFTVAPVVTATARLSTGVIIDRAWATLNTAPTTTTAAGYTLRGNPVSGSGDSVRFAPNVTVMIMAVGI